MKGFTGKLVGSLYPITEEECKQIHQAAVRVLEEGGLRCCGATVTGTAQFVVDQGVCIMVIARAVLPSTVGGRRRGPRVSLKC